MIRVAEVFAGGMVLINGAGLYRVILGGRIRELLERHEAEAAASVYETANPGKQAIITDYVDVQVASNSSEI